MRTFSLILLSLISIVMLPGAQAAVPTASNNTITINEDSTYAFSEADFGYFDADGDVFTSIQITTLATAGTLLFNGDVALDQVINASNLTNFTFKPALNQHGNDGYGSFQFTVNDGVVSSASSYTITFNVLPVDDPPYLITPPLSAIDEDSPYNSTPIVGDVDSISSLTFSIENQPAWITTFDPGSGRLSGTPENEDVGVHSNIILTVVDTAGLITPLPAFSITVNNTNDAPTFTNSPPISINEDMNYDFTLTATDVDIDVVGDLVFSITPGTFLPVWLKLGPGTPNLESIEGRPNNDDVGTYNNISFTVTDDKGKSTSMPPFSITVVNVNDSPTGNIEIVGDHAEDTILSVNTNLVDDDGLGAFRYQWQRNGINVSTNSDYLLGDADVGQTISVTISYIDRRGTDEPPIGDESTRETLRDVAGTILGVNDPVLGDVTISGQPYIGETLTAGNTLSDADGLNTFSYEWKRGETPITTGISNTYLLSAADEGQTITATIHYTDGQGFSENKTSNPTAQITTAPDPGQDSDGDGMSDIDEIKYGLNPDINDAELDLDGDGITNLDELNAGTDPTKDDYPPVNFIIPADKTINSTGLLTAVDLGIATAIDGKDGVISAIPDNSGPFRPGIHTISWTATDAAGNTSTASTTQTVNVIPMVDFAIDQISNEGTTATVSVHLNGAITSDLEIPFTLDGSTATADDHNIGATNFIAITNGYVSGSIPVNLINNADTDDETLIFTLDNLPAGVIAGSKLSHTITITEQNIAPKVSLLMTQGGTHTSTVVADADPDPNNVAIVYATVTALVTDSNAKTVFDWSESDNVLVGDTTDGTFTFNPGLLKVGTYTIVVKVSDDGGLVSTQRHRFKVVVSVPADENHEDRDDDGIADQYDEIELSHVIALQQVDQSRHLVETEPGLQLRLGAIAFESATNGLQVSASTIEAYARDIRFPYDDYFNVGGLFDFEIHGLTTAGDSALVVIPLRNQIPTNPYYRKLMPTGWQNFIVDDNNALASAPGSNGSCPPPNHSTYSQGLTPGHWCVQLQLEDGGPNDADGVANGAIIDPGGVAVEPITSEQPPPPEVLPLPGTGGGALYSVLLLLLALAYSRSYRCHHGSP